LVTISGLIKTIRVVKNPQAVFIAKITKNMMKITFKNGTKARITLRQFCFFRDHFSLVEKYKLQQVSEDTFRIQTDSIQLIGSQVLMCIIDEIESGIYNYDCCGKVVLDIGGFEGESAAYFWSKGAKKVIIYEPVVDHIPTIKQNISLNRINAEIHQEGIGFIDGEIIVVYDQADNCFGLNGGKLQNKMIIKVRNITQVLAESSADVAKIDCEGAEISIVNVPPEILRRTEYFMIEVHTTDIRKKLLEKFQSSGFALEKERNDNGNISMLYFKRLPKL
jgi:FkbM family methyltransferase